MRDVHVNSAFQASGCAVLRPMLAHDDGSADTFSMPSISGPLWWSKKKAKKTIAAGSVENLGVEMVYPSGVMADAAFRNGPAAAAASRETLFRLEALWQRHHGPFSTPPYRHCNSPTTPWRALSCRDRVRCRRPFR
jgi:hypothetical protein